jgi:hypothetical protein
MYVVCINNGRITHSGSFAKLTLGKKYKVQNNFRDWDSVGVHIINDDGVSYYYNISRFMTIDEYRESRINKLGLN